MKRPAFTLVETVLSLTLITLILSAVFMLSLTSFDAVMRTRHNVEALGLAQEGLEAVRYLRDLNVMNNYAWNGAPGEASMGGFYYAPSMGEKSFPLNWNEIESTYSLSGSADVELGDAVYQRDLVFSPVEGANGAVLENVIEVTAVVAWKEKGLDRNVKLSTYLSDWFKN